MLVVAAEAQATLVREAQEAQEAAALAPVHPIQPQRELPTQAAGAVACALA
jgi:hypothetical protein